MRTSIFALAAFIAHVSAQEVTATPGSLPVGSLCSSNEQCANGAQCYGVSSFTIRTCGSFQSACTSDSQCATNTCNQGFCNGLLPSSTAETASSTASIYIPSQVPVDAAPGSLPLGAHCTSSEQCANGADCYATNSLLVTRCGNFQASCTSDSQCATNTCNQGFCNGLLPSSSVEPASPTASIIIPSQVPVDAAPGSLPVGAHCTSSEQCANGADCYATNSLLETRCGNFQAACTNDSQCATNRCNQGACNGELLSNPTSIGSPTETPTFPTVTALPGTLPVGALCSSSEQCANGAQCYAVSSFTVTTCGSFQASCTSDSQCATNTCNQGFCNGQLPSGSMSTVITTPTSSSNSTPTAPTATATYTGAASKISVGQSVAFFAVVFVLAL